MILAAYSVVLLLVLLLPALRTRARLKSGVSAQGTVVGVEKSTSSTDSGRVDTDYYPKVEFTTPDGRTVVFTSAFGSDSEPELGHPVAVRYDPDNPQQAEWDTAWVWGCRQHWDYSAGWGCSWPQSSCTCRNSQPANG